VYFGELACNVGKQSGSLTKYMAVVNCLVSSLYSAGHDAIRLFHHLRVLAWHVAVRLWLAGSGNRTCLDELL